MNYDQYVRLRYIETSNYGLHNAEITRFSIKTSSPFPLVLYPISRRGKLNRVTSDKSDYCVGAVESRRPADRRTKKLYPRATCYLNTNIFLAYIAWVFIRTHFRIKLVLMTKNENQNKLQNEGKKIYFPWVKTSWFLELLQ